VQATQHPESFVTKILLTRMSAVMFFTKMLLTT
jgi:hypothetical protein